MKHRSVIKWGLGMIMIIFLISSIGQMSWGKNEVGAEELVFPVSYSDIILHPDEMTEDLEFIINTLKDVHPILTYKENRQIFNELANLALEKVQQPMSRQEFYLLANQLVNFFGDPQTHLWFQFEDRYLPLKLRWVSNGIIVTDVWDSELPISVGDELVGLGGYRPDDLLAELRKLIPNENDYRVQALGGEYLTTGFVLDVLGAISDKGIVEMTFCRATGEEYVVNVPWHFKDLEAGDQQLVCPERDFWYGWYIKKEQGYGLFWLDICKNTEDFITALDRFYAAVHTTGVHNVVIDLRRNMGGDIEVLDSFLTYLPLEIVQYPRTKVRYSRQAHKNGGYSRLTYFFSSVFKRFWDGEKAVPRPKDEEMIFEGNTYVLISNQTFGEATLLAAVLRDNGLATILGEPTGSAPSSYGEPLQFYTPNLNLYLTVSYKKYFRPDLEKDIAVTLVPDFLIPTTIQDLRMGRDPQIEWVESYFKRLTLD